MMPPCSLCTRVGGGGYGGVTALRMVLELGVSWVSALVTVTTDEIAEKGGGVGCAKCPGRSLRPARRRRGRRGRRGFGG